MTDNEKRELKKKAEQRIVKLDDNLDQLEKKDLKALVHDLRVHQIELEIQNEELQRIQEELSKARNRYLDLFQNAPAGYLILNSVGQIKTVNKTFCDLVSRNPEDILNTAFADLIHEEDRLIFWGRFRVFSSNPEGKILELRLRSSKGAYVFCRLEGKLDQNNQIISKDEDKHLLLIVTDISQRKEYEYKLKESQVRYSSLFNNAHTPMLIVAPQDYIILEYNQAAASFYNLDEDKLLKRSIFDLHPVDRGILDQALDKSQGKAFLSTVYKNEQGNFLFVDIYAGPVQISGNSYFCLFLHDVSESKQAEIALAQYFENSTIYQCILNRECHFIRANNTFKKELNMSMEQLSEHELCDFIAEEDKLRVKSKMAATLKEDNFYTTKTGFIIATGQKRVIEWYLNINHELSQIYVTGLDITEKEIILEQFRHNDKMRVIGQLAGGIAHDFNNILGAIIGFADMSLDDVAKDSVLNGNLNQILKAAYRARDLVKQILYFSSPKQFNREKVFLYPIMQDIQGLLKTVVPSSIELKLHIKKDKYPVFADSSTLHESIMNLVLNSVQALNNKGKLEISLYSQNVKEAISGRFGLLAEGRYSVIEVKDSGPGMSPEVLDKIFEPFYTHKKEQGTGLGLFIVYSVIQGCGGNIKVNSTPGEGTSFKLYFPHVAEAKQKPALAKQERLKEGKGEILYVDDEEDLVFIKQRQLEKFGYKVYGFTSSENALKAIEKDPYKFDIIITDYAMPRLTGTELTEKILALNPHAKIILCTGYSDVVDKQNAKEIGFSGLCLKPVDKYELINLIQKLMDGE